ncbi:MAG: cation-transporting P-type ATPase [Hyphomicrobiaceae bacterium]|nr:cation-transporting P-type ATPase [Hyphomicrobiaceae bacterium]
MNGTGQHHRARGLASAEASARLARHGPNTLPEPEPVSAWHRIAQQFKSALIYILLAALLLDLGLWIGEGAHGWPIESIAIALILALNAGLGAWQEAKAEEAVARLRAMAAPSVWVMRDGRLVHLPASVLVPGDIVRIEAGDRVPADGTMVEADGVMADESILTGESLPVDKEEGAEAFSGSLIVRGKCLLEVTRTGAGSAMGRLATMIGGIEAGKTPLERRLGEFGNQVAIGILLLGLALTAGGIVVEGPERIGQIVLFAVALAVAAVPEGLPAVLTLTLALGVERLASRKAIVRRLSAVEALGSVTVIATDKTGTLTENRIEVREVIAVDTPRALEAMVLANDADLATGAGDPLEVALLARAAAGGIDVQQLQGERPRASIRPFDSVAKIMRVTVIEDGRHVSYVKGAPEVMIAASRLTPDQKRDWEARALSHAGEGFRVIALGAREGEGEDDLSFLGLVLLWDPPRAEVPDAVRRAHSAGIRVLMITGDHPATAEAVARVIGIETPRAVTGAELEALPEAALRDVVKSVNVFARVAPEHKLRLVELLRAAGEIVAVTGDGVNDAPALKRADVGVAMGLRGSDVSREVADVVLADDNFASIVTAIEEGRSIYENIQKFIRFFFSTDLALIVLMTAGLGLAFLAGLKDPAGGTFLLPLTAVQLLWINVVADGPPALALALDRNPDVMTRPPRPPSSRLLDADSLHFIVVSGLVKASVGIGFLALLPRLGYSLDATRTTVFLYESLMQIVFVYPCRRVHLVPLPNLWVHLAVGLGVALQLATVMLAPLRTLLGLAPLNLTTIGIVLAASLVTWGVAEFLWRWRGLWGRPPASA